MHIVLSSRRMLVALAVGIVAAMGPAPVVAQQLTPDRINGGDFRPGDRISIQVDSEPQLSDTMMIVVAGPALLFKVIGQVSLAGVKRAELEPYLTRVMGRFIKSPVVHARTLLRVAVLGEVARPSFYTVPADGSMVDVLQAAGGLTATAQISEVQIIRTDTTLLSADSLRAALTRGQSLAELGIQNGDQFVVPRAPSHTEDAARIAQIMAVVVTIPTSLFLVLRGAKW